MPINESIHVKCPEQQLAHSKSLPVFPYGLSMSVPPLASHHLYLSSSQPRVYREPQSPGYSPGELNQSPGWDPRLHCLCLCVLKFPVWFQCVPRLRTTAINTEPSTSLTRTTVLTQTHSSQSQEHGHLGATPESDPAGCSAAWAWGIFKFSRWF